MILVEILPLAQFCDPKVKLQESDLLCFHRKHLGICGIPLVFALLREGLPFVG